MFDYLKGQVVEVGEDYLVLENNSIGYKIFTAENNYFKDFLEKTICVYLYQQISEQENALFGFATKVVRDCFLLLISVSGIGPKLAVKILRDQKVDELLGNIVQKNLEYLKTIKGLGEKTAKRILLELSKKAEKLLQENFEDLTDLASSVEDDSRITKQAREALLGLGYKDFEIKKSIANVSKRNEKISSLEDFLKECLLDLG